MKIIDKGLCPKRDIAIIKGYMLLFIIKVFVYVECLGQNIRQRQGSEFLGVKGAKSITLSLQAAARSGAHTNGVWGLRHPPIFSESLQNFSHKQRISPRQSLDS